MAKNQYKCNRCHRGFIYAKPLQKHMLACKGISASNAKALESGVLPLPNAVQMEPQDDILKDAIHCTEEIKEEIDIDIGPIDEAIFSYRAPVPEKQQKISSRVALTEPTIKDSIVSCQIKKQHSSGTRMNEGNSSKQMENGEDRICDTINTNESRYIYLDTSEDSFSENDSDVEFISDGKDRPGKTKSSAAIQGPGKHKSAIAIQIPQKSKELNQKTTHKCDQCNSSFVTSDLLNDHRNKHVQNKSLEHRSSLKEHRNQRIEMLYHKCTICEKRYAFASELEKHHKQHLKMKPHKCTKCDKRFLTQFALNRHLQTHRPSTQKYKCTYCGTGFATLDEFNLHLETHKEAKTNVYNDGNAPANGSSQVDPLSRKSLNVSPKKLHLPTHTKTVDIVLMKHQQGPPSQTANKGNHSNRNLSSQHIIEKDIIPESLLKDRENIRLAGDAEIQVNSRSEAHNDVVALDNLEFLNSKEASQLQNSKLSTSMLGYCDDLGQVSVLKMKDKNSQSNERSYNCSKCKKTFITQSLLNAHISTQHFKSRLYNCFLCPAECSNFRDLEKHARAKHMYRDAYKCISCSETFQQPAGIKTHIAMFHGDKGTAMHGCNHCDAIFLGLPGLHDHIKEHLLHKCTSCEKSFGTFTDLKTHMENHSDYTKSSAFKDKNTRSQLSSNVSQKGNDAMCRHFDKIYSTNVQDQNSQSHKIWIKQGTDSDKTNHKNELRRDTNSTDHQDDHSKTSGETLTLYNSNKHCTGGEDDGLSEKTKSAEDSLIRQTFRSRERRHKNSDNGHLGIKAHVCHVCKKSFAFQRALKEHLKSHKKGKSYKCDQCDASFRRSVQLTAHQTQHICKQSFEFERDLEEHLKAHKKRISCKCDPYDTISQKSDFRNVQPSPISGDNAHECHICNQSFEFARDLKQHLKLLKDSYKCEQCGASFQKSGELKTHETIHVEDRIYACRICEKSFTHVRYLRRHFRRIHTKNSYKCDQCDATFQRSDHRNAHQNRHKAYVCQICKKSFELERYLKEHQKTEHKKKKSQIKCEQCEDSFQNLDQLKAHQTKHLQDKGYVCHICNKSFTGRPYLKTHLEGHMGTWRFKCNLCEKSFGSNYSLQEHKNRHLGIRPHKCKKCDNAFVTIYGLRRHLSVHLPDHMRKKPHECSLCDQSFTTNSHLKRHIGRKHAVTPSSKSKHKETTRNVPPLTCRTCHKTFNRGQLLNEHLKRKHGGLKGYSCNYCDEAFITPTELEAHLRQHLTHMCTFCRKGFSTLDELKKHLRIHCEDDTNSQ